MKNNLFLHLDTIDANCTDAFNCDFPLSYALRDVNKIHLKSIELPITFYNIRNTGTMNVFKIKANNIIYSVTIQENNYKTIENLLLQINNGFVGIIPSSTVTLSQITNTNKINVTITTSSFSSFEIVPTTLSQYILGFKTNITNSLSLNSTCDYVLFIDNYISLYFKNIQTNSNSSYRLCHFKIPLTQVNGVILFGSDNQNFKQYITLANSSQIIDKIQIQVYDRFNNPILNNNADYSLTLEIEF